MADIIVSVVIPTYNRSAVLGETLKRLAAQSVTVPWEVVVVNNRCTDNTDDVVAKLTTRFPSALRVVHEDKPGASAARNRGIGSARGSLIVLLDDDIYLGAGQLERAVADHLARPTSWFVAQIVPLPEHQSTPFALFRSAAMVPPPPGPFPEVDTFASGFAVVPRSSLLEIGGYNEDYPIAALEDADLFIRARHRGVRVTYDSKLVGTHNDWAGTTLRDFCHRQRVYCRTAPLLKERFGDEPHPWSALVAANSRPDLGSDGTQLIFRKRLKSLLSREIPMTILFGAAEHLERSGRSQRLLWAIYRVTIGASMYGGYQEGMDAFSRPREPLRTA